MFSRAAKSVVKFLGQRKYYVDESSLKTAVIRSKAENNETISEILKLTSKLNPLSSNNVNFINKTSPSKPIRIHNIGNGEQFEPINRTEELIRDLNRLPIRETSLLVHQNNCRGATSQGGRIGPEVRVLAETGHEYYNSSKSVDQVISKLKKNINSAKLNQSQRGTESAINNPRQVRVKFRSIRDKNLEGDNKNKLIIVDNSRHERKKYFEKRYKECKNERSEEKTQGKSRNWTIPAAFLDRKPKLLLDFQHRRRKPMTSLFARFIQTDADWSQNCIKRKLIKTESNGQLIRNHKNMDFSINNQLRESSPRRLNVSTSMDDLTSNIINNIPQETLKNVNSHSDTNLNVQQQLNNDDYNKFINNNERTSDEEDVDDKNTNKTYIQEISSKVALFLENIKKNEIKSTSVTSLISYHLGSLFNFEEPVSASLSWKTILFATKSDNLRLKMKEGIQNFCQKRFGSCKSSENKCKKGDTSRSNHDSCAQRRESICNKKSEDSCGSERRKSESSCGGGAQEDDSCDPCRKYQKEKHYGPSCKNSDPCCKYRKVEHYGASCKDDPECNKRKDKPKDKECGKFKEMLKCTPSKKKEEKCPERKKTPECTKPKKDEPRKCSGKKKMPKYTTTKKDEKKCPERKKMPVCTKPKKEQPRKCPEKKKMPDCTKPKKEQPRKCPEKKKMPDCTKPKKEQPRKCPEKKKMPDCTKPKKEPRKCPEKKKMPECTKPKKEQPKKCPEIKKVPECSKPKKEQPKKCPEIKKMPECKKSEEKQKIKCPEVKKVSDCKKEKSPKDGCKKGGGNKSCKNYSTFAPRVNFGNKFYCNDILRLRKYHSDNSNIKEATNKFFGKNSYHKDIFELKNHRRSFRTKGKSGNKLYRSYSTFIPKLDF